MVRHVPYDKPMTEEKERELIEGYIFLTGTQERGEGGMKVLSVKVDEIPNSCGECCMMKYVNDTYPQCCALPDDISEISGSSYDMKYRRHDCPLECEKEVI